MAQPLIAPKDIFAGMLHCHILPLDKNADSRGFVKLRHIQNRGQVVGYCNLERMTSGVAQRGSSCRLHYMITSTGYQYLGLA